MNIQGWGKSPPSLLRPWDLLALAFWPEGNGILDMEADCALVVEEFESKPKERGQEGRLMWEGVAEEYRRSWS